MADNIWRMVFAGRTDMDVQGVYFRQIIKEIADGDELMLKGQVRNLKDGSVEVICECERRKAKNFYDSIIRKAKAKGIRIKEEKCITPTEDIFEFKKEFKIIREDDLREMVWALQGAGRVFKEQEEVKRAEMINGLRYELHSISETSEKIIDEMKVNRRLRLISMKKILAQPPIWFK